MSIIDRVFNALIVEGRELSAKQMAAYFRTTEGTIKARIHDLRREGNVIYLNRRVDSNGRVVLKYRTGTPTQALIAAGYSALDLRAA